MHKKKGSFGFATCRDMANAILENIEGDNGVIEKIELAQAGQGDPAKSGWFMNIFLKAEFIQAQIKSLYMNETVQLQETLDIQAAASEEESKEGSKR